MIILIAAIATTIAIGIDCDWKFKVTKHQLEVDKIQRSK